MIDSAKLNGKDNVVAQNTVAPIPLSRASVTDVERQLVSEAMANPHMEGGGPFSRQAETLLEQITGGRHVLLTHSGTHALELAISLANLKPGDEVIVPSFTFSSTATAVIAGGAIPVFVDIDPATYNIDPDAIRAALTERTRAIIPVHYAGVGCEMEQIQAIANEHDLLVIEDAAHAIGASWRGRALGSFGKMAAFSFHATKNLSCGEGGALVINDEALYSRAELLIEKGTSRRHLIQGKVDKYHWVDIGSSYQPSEVTAAMLVGQLTRMETINSSRLAIWNRYAAHPTLLRLKKDGLLAFQSIPTKADHNAHLFSLLLNSQADRDGLSKYMALHGVAAYRHYVPLHDAPAGVRYGRTVGEPRHTQDVAERLIRLPLFPELSNGALEKIVELVDFYLSHESKSG